MVGELGEVIVFFGGPEPSLLMVDGIIVDGVIVVGVDVLLVVEIVVDELL